MKMMIKQYGDDDRLSPEQLIVAEILSGVNLLRYDYLEG